MEPGGTPTFGMQVQKEEAANEVKKKPPEIQEARGTM